MPSKRVFLVEDHPALRKGMQEMMTAAYEADVHAEGTLTGAIAAFRERFADVDVVLSDFNLGTETSAPFLAEVARLAPDLFAHRTAVYSLNTPAVIAAEFAREGATPPPTIIDKNEIDTLRQWMRQMLS